jgi:rhamnose utilization protein RhaD (predicted bifunctional aldolase and dehydrogenase)/NAD(P)-dependent dehydrogenase (short-subunit alcohol dehydrogenase family)
VSGGRDPGAADSAPAARWPRDLALRVESSRRYGADPSLVLHGGGNTSVKLRRDEHVGLADPAPAVRLAGAAREVLWVKGSGIDLAGIGPEGFTPLDLERLRPVEGWDDAGEEDAGALLEAARLDPRAPFPSVEALLHAFVPARFVDHTHAEDVLVVANQPDGRERLATLLGGQVAVLDYVQPGLALARAVAAAVRERDDLEGVVVRHHGVFSWGESAKRAHGRMTSIVERCRSALPRRPAARFSQLGAGAADADTAGAVAALAPVLRGALARRSDDAHHRVVLVSRCDPATMELLTLPDLPDRARRALVTPDHLNRTGPWPLVLDLPDPAAAPDALRESIAAGLDAWRAAYRRYAGLAGIRADDPLADATPRVVLVPRVGLFAAGPGPGEAKAAAELGLRALATVEAGDALGRYEPPAQHHAAELEFWSLQRAKLARDTAGPLAGRVALVTGAAGAIGCGVAAALARAGAFVLLADLPGPEGSRRLARTRERVAGAACADRARELPFDVTEPAGVDAAFAEAARIAGGVDLLVLSHGVAEVGDIAALPPERVRQVFDINALGSFHLLGAFARGVERGGTGGDVVLVSTKNVPEPGASFAAYSASKAAAHQLARVAAIELAPLGVRVNLVAPDAVFGDEEIPSQLWQDVGARRARSKGMDPAELPERYRQRNLLKARVTAAHVAAAVLFFAERRTPTTGAVLPVDGGLPGAFPR